MCSCARKSPAIPTSRLTATASVYRLDVTSFVSNQLAGDKTVARNGVLVSRTVVTTREYTNAQLHELFVSGSHVRDLSSGWRLRLSGDVAPAAVSRLAIQLPDKYPGQTLVYRTTNLIANGELEVGRRIGNWPTSLFLLADPAWNYRSSQSVQRGAIALCVAVGRSW